MFRKIVSISFIFVISCSAFARDDITVLRLAHGLNTNHPVHKAMVYMAEKVEQMSNGQMKVLIYPNEELGNEKECLEAVQLGYLSMTKVSSGDRVLCPRFQDIRHTVSFQGP